MLKKVNYITRIYIFFVIIWLALSLLVTIIISIIKTSFRKIFKIIKLIILKK